LKVRCIKVLSSSTRSAPAMQDAWVTVGKEYLVLGVYGRAASFKYRLIGFLRCRLAADDAGGAQGGAIEGGDARLFEDLFGMLAERTARQRHHCLPASFLHGMGLCRTPREQPMKVGGRSVGA
jgi:hypothetical protein